MDVFSPSFILDWPPNFGSIAFMGLARPISSSNSVFLSMVPSYIRLEQQSDILMDNFLHGIPHRFTCPMTTARVRVWNNKKSFANNMGYQFPIYSSPASTMPMQGQFCKGVWRKLAVSGTGWVGRCVYSNWVWLLTRSCVSIFTGKEITHIWLDFMFRPTLD